MLLSNRMMDEVIDRIWGANCFPVKLCEVLIGPFMMCPCGDGFLQQHAGVVVCAISWQGKYWEEMENKII
jgi:hypothetical protein